MDSGNSGSMSSSGGDEEYDSRPDSLPSFLNPSTHFGSLSSSNLFSHHQQQPTFFDPSPNLFHSFSQSPANPNLNSPLVNLDLVRSRSLRSNNNQVDCTDLGNNNHLLSSSSSATAAAAAASSSQSILGSVPSMQLRSVQDNGSSARSSSPSDQTHLVTRNPKKRTRASRRAPTTVLTTDTSNFRAMVQEFTGIPAPPFSGSPYSRRLDLFGSGMRSSHLDPMGSLYPLRPSAQKVDQQSPFLFSSTSSPPSLNNTHSTTAATTTTTLSIPIGTTSSFNPTSINYSDLDLGMAKQPQNMLNMQNQNQMFSFQSLLQPPSIHPSLPLPLLEDMGMNNHGQVNINNISGLHGTTTTTTTTTATTQGMRLMRNDHNQHQDHLRSLDSCKLNYSASSSDFHDKGLENVPPRGEGTVDSWICPSE